MDIYLKETVMLDFSNPDIQKLIERKRWKEQNEFDRIKAIYNFVRDDVLFICEKSVYTFSMDVLISKGLVLLDHFF